MIRVRTLGQSWIHVDSVALGPDAEIVFAALVLLTVEPGKRITRGELLGILWPAATASRARHCLRQTIYRMRTLGVPLEVSRTHRRVRPEAVDCDVDALLRIRQADDLERVDETIGGPFLPGYAPSFSEPLPRSLASITSAPRPMTSLSGVILICGLCHSNRGSIQNPPATSKTATTRRTMPPPGTNRLLGLPNSSALI